MPSKKHIATRGFSIIEALVGVFLFTMAFYALYGVLGFSFALISQNKARLGAQALVDEQMEYLRSLPFASVGVVSGNPSGAIPATESISLNGISYTRRNVIFWVDDPKDGIAPADTISTDYKQVKIEVSWNFRGTTKKFFTVTNITPKGMETNVPGGIFKITVADATTAPVQGANVNIKNATTGLNVNRLTPSSGIWYEYGLPPAVGYEITVTKPGYNSAQTYGTAAVANPDPAHLTSIDDNVNAKTFFIDKVSGETATIYNIPAAGTWSDTFTDASKLASMASTTVNGDDLVLTQNDPGVYAQNGSATSTWIAPADMYRWTEVSWSATKPVGTNLFYQIYYDNAGTATLVPDGKIPGNSAGLSVSPVSLTGLNDQPFGLTGNARLKISVMASTADTGTTPELHDWTVKYDVHAPRPNFTFNMRGAKTIGTDGGGATVYKFNQNLATDAFGVFATTTIEWDTYAISKTGYDIAESCPAQPQYIAPNTFPSVFIDMTNSVPHAILVQVKDALGADVPGAHVRLYRASPAFNQMKTAGLRCGQAFWNGLSEGTAALGDSYSIDASAPPYTSTTTTANVDVSGYSTFTAVVN